MGVEHYLKDLLYRYNCVVVPGFGAFLTQKKSAKIHKATNTFYSPRKFVSFNKQLSSNDGLLVSHISKAENKNYEAVLRAVDEVVADWHRRLKKGEKLNLPDIGELWQNKTGRIQFQPSERENYLTSSFGLAPFVSSPVTREVLKEKVVKIEEKVPLTITPEARKEHAYTLRPYLKYAAIFLLALSTAVTGYRTYQNGIAKQQLAEEEAQEQVSKYIQEATFFETAPLELPVLNLNVTPKAVVKSPVVAEKVESRRASGQKVHHIIAGAFRYRTNANKKINQLKRRGFNPSYIGTNPFGLHMVAYETFTDSKKALSVLKDIKRNHSKDAWLKSVK